MRLLLVLVLFTGVNVYAQPPGRVSGRVLDQTSAALPGVAIDLVVNSDELTAVTDDRRCGYDLRLETTSLHPDSDRPDHL